MASATNLYVGDGSWQLDGESWTRGMRASLGRLADAGIISVVLSDTPRPGFDVPECLSREHAGRPFHDGCRYSLADASNDAAHDADRRAVTGSAHAALLNLNHLVCDSPECGVVDAGTPISNDGGHLSVGFAEGAAESFELALLLALDRASPQDS